MFKLDGNWTIQELYKGIDDVGITFLQLKKNIGAMKTNSSIVQVQIDYYGSAPSRTATALTIVLLNKKEVQYFYLPPVVVNITCDPMKKAYKVGANCATDPSLEVDCPGDYRYGYVQFTCPSIKKYLCALHTAALVMPSSLRIIVRF